MRKETTMAENCPHGWPPWIHCDKCLDVRVAAAERKGMERAAGIADRAAEEIDRDRGLSADSAIAAGIAVTIRADRGA